MTEKKNIYIYININIFEIYFLFIFLFYLFIYLFLLFFSGTQLRICVQVATPLHANRITVNDWRLLCLTKIIDQLNYSESHTGNLLYWDTLIEGYQYSDEHV